MVGYYLVGAVEPFRRRGFVDFCGFVNGGIFCGICGFLAVAFFNNGSVNARPVFACELGTGLAINLRDKWPGGDFDRSCARRWPFDRRRARGRKEEGEEGEG